MHSILLYSTPELAEIVLIGLLILPIGESW